MPPASLDFSKPSQDFSMYGMEYLLITIMNGIKNKTEKIIFIKAFVFSLVNL